MHDFETRVGEAKRAIRAASVDGVQRRSVPFTFEVRAKGDGYTLAGHAAVFNDLSENLGGFREKIDPGAFAKVLGKGPDVRALFNHDPNLVLARTTNKTLALREDDTGLHYEADVADTSYGRDLRVLLDRGDVDQSSFAFRVAEDSWDEDPDTGGLIRTIHEFSGLYDVSPVTYPAYPTTDAGTASRDDVPDEDEPSQDDGEREPKADAQEQGETAPSDDEQAEESQEESGLDRDTLARRMKLRQRRMA